MSTSVAVVFEAPGSLALRPLALDAAKGEDVLVDVEWTGISTGTERLLYTGKMPPFPGLAYPLVPGYETVGRVVRGDDAGRFAEGDRVFVPGASCFGEVRGLFGGAASRLAVPAARIAKLGASAGQESVLLALAATAHHALVAGPLPELIVGHGVLGRLLARLTVALGGHPTVWEKNPDRLGGARAYPVVLPEDDPRRDYPAICDVSGDAGLLETLIGRLGKGGEICLAGFYSERLSFAFPLAFMKEARLRVAAEWAPADLEAVLGLLGAERLALDGLISHERPYAEAAEAYETAFNDASCLKMVLDWRSCS
ncbi:MAG: chlorophyll synthesis pathway protein BchC [Myxococcota bacterium]